MGAGTSSFQVERKLVRKQSEVPVLTRFFFQNNSFRTLYSVMQLLISITVLFPVFMKLT
jgi:hypothetical protein